jgi:hypothetical protein
MTPQAVMSRDTLVAPSLSDALLGAVQRRDDAALADLAGAEPSDERDLLLTLHTIHDMWMAPLWVSDGIEEYQAHPVVAELKWRLEHSVLDGLNARIATAERSSSTQLADGPPDAVAAIRRIAASDLVPAVYTWLAEEASWSELVAFLAIEGGPDAGFDDLVAIAQVGIHDGAKVALARNYWDELGRGSLDEVHTVLHDRLVEATRMPRIPRRELPVSALERMLIGGILATNRRLQPEMIGALGLLELQAGPRCRAVVQALTRLDAPAGAFPFYEEHARADPRHGKEWLDEVVTPLAAEHPEWGPRMVLGARWRHEVNARFFDEARLFTGS